MPLNLTTGAFKIYILGLEGTLIHKRLIIIFIVPFYPIVWYLETRATMICKYKIPFRVLTSSLYNYCFTNFIFFDTEPT